MKRKTIAAMLFCCLLPNNVYCESRADSIKQERNQQLPELRVFGQNNTVGGLNTAQMSAHYIPADVINHIPMLMGETDVLKALQRFPGVQNANDGLSGIMVRGGRYDQNMITLDGALIYHAEHLKGFTSAVDASIVRDVCFYKGAFPARFGGQLSSVVDVGVDNGCPTRYHGQVSIGTLSSNFQITGPIQKGKTWFNAAGRLSYFNLIMRPILESVSDNSDLVSPYANLNYYDATVKLTHIANNTNSISALFYFGRDVDNTKPTPSVYNSNNNNGSIMYGSDAPQQGTYSESRLANSTDSNWGNLLASLKWHRIYSSRLEGSVHAGYSSFNSKLQQEQEQTDAAYTENSILGGQAQRDYQAIRQYSSTMNYHSAIQNAYLATDYLLNAWHNHEVRWGLKAEYVHYNPQVDLYELRYKGFWDSDQNSFVEDKEINNKTVGKTRNVKQLSVYAEDDMKLLPWFSTNIGVRYMLYGVTGKTYHSVEPRVSARFKFADKMAVKVSYSRMSQANHLLSSSNLVMPSDLWVPVTASIPLSKSNQYALGYEWQLPHGFYLNIEGFYKTIDNLLDYVEGASYASQLSDWEQLVAVGKGKSYGAELMLEKKLGNTTGWISYTWSKSLNTFNRHDMELNGGKEFYANNDRRHNFNLMLMHSFSKKFDVSLGWTYQTGHRGNISTTLFYAGNLDEYLDISKFVGGYWDDDIVNNASAWTDKPSFFQQFMLVSNYRERNCFVLPAIHRLDLGINYHIFHHLAHFPVESRISLSFYNVYNRKNVSSVSYGYKDNKLVLKGLCLLPFMPSVKYSLIF